MKKDETELDDHKKKMIEEIKQLNRTEMFTPKPNKKISILSKVLRILGYGKKE